MSFVILGPYCAALTARLPQSPLPCGPGPAGVGSSVFVCSLAWLPCWQSFKGLDEMPTSLHGMTSSAPGGLCPRYGHWTRSSKVMGGRFFILLFWKGTVKHLAWILAGSSKEEMFCHILSVEHSVWHVVALVAICWMNSSMK